MKKILVIEDEEDFAQLMCVRLQGAGYETHHAADGIQAYEMVRKSKPDLVVLDLMLPGGDGLSILKKIRRSVQTREIPVAVMTAKEDPHYKEWIVAEGVSCYFQKPCDLAAFTEEIKKIVPPN
ncbi:MAG: response regulator [Candidatus Omnitrophota bacterium]|jgi:two-component system alkaline phosphatase synthesis response regulator PhoP